MLRGKIFQNGKSQAVRLPKECRFATSEVNIQKIGDIVMLLPDDNKKWSSFLHALDMFTEDYMEERGQDATLQERDLM